MKAIRVVLALFVLMSFGCGPSTTSVPVKAPGIEQIRPILEAHAQSGVKDSGLMVVREELEKLKATDAAKADGLLKILDELEASKDAGAIKAKAKELAGKL